MYIPKYFKLEEFLKSYAAKNIGTQNSPNFEAVENLSRLCELVLDPVRRDLGEPIYITSGFRNFAVNNAVGGVRNSQHLRGLAADIKCSNLNKLWDMLRRNYHIDQLIWESKDGVRWIHVSIAEIGVSPRNEVLHKEV